MNAPSVPARSVAATWLVTWLVTFVVATVISFVLAGATYNPTPLSRDWATPATGALAAAPGPSTPADRPWLRR